MADKPAFTRDQVNNASIAARNFGELRRKAKIAPQIILDNGNYDSVLLDYEHYERLITRLQDLEDQIISERAERLDQDPSLAVPWRKIRRTKEE